MRVSQGASLSTVLTMQQVTHTVTCKLSPRLVRQVCAARSEWRDEYLYLPPL